MAHREDIDRLRASQLGARWRARSTEFRARSLVFHHISKTAGTTLGNIFLANIPTPHLISVSYDPAHVSAMGTWSLDDVRRAVSAFGTGAFRECQLLLSGHLPAGAKDLLPRPSNFMTILRDPSCRAISNFNYVVHFGILTDLGKTCRLQDYVRQESPHLWFTNNMTRSLVGGKAVDPFDAPLTQRLTPYYELDSSHVTEAIALLASAASFVGIQERFDETVVLLAALMGWSLCDVAYQSKNIGPKMSSNVIDSETLRAVAACNSKDAEIYKWGLNRFDAYVAEYGPRLAEHLSLFRELLKCHREGVPISEMERLERQGFEAFAAL